MSEELKMTAPYDDSPNSPTALKSALIALKDMRAKLDAMERTRTEPIAIIGMACRFPGGANDPEAFWKLLHDGVDGTSDVPANRWDADAYYDPDPNAPGKMYVRRSGFVDDIDQFEPQFFGISPREAVSMDPQQRLLLEVAWEALEYAGLIPGKLTGSQTGVFIGISTNDYSRLHLGSSDMSYIDPYMGTGTAFSVAAGRLSYTLGLHGPNIALDTACSSSLVGVHLACQSLRSGQANLALAGGVNVILSPESTISMSKARALAPDGRSKTFDASADGYSRGEGCGIVVLKRYSDALADGDNILALIRGTAINHDGRSSGLTVPNGLAQQEVIRAALANTGGIQPQEVSYVETHGTGTQLGDPIEVRAVAAVLGKDRAQDQPLLLGSVKSHIGHAEAAAGMASLIKVILALQYEQIPAQLHFKVPNPHIDWETLPLKVVDKTTEWKRGDAPRIAGINSFGISGTNSHVVLEEAPLLKSETTQAERPLHILALSANDHLALTETARRYKSYFEKQNNIRLADAAFTANTGRSPFSHRLALIGDSVQQIREKLDAFLTSTNDASVLEGTTHGTTPPKIAFLFTGQGSQYVNMGRQLYETQPAFRESMNRCDALLQPYLERSLLSILYPESGDDSLVNETAYTQPALFAIEYSLSELWRSWGIVPSMMMGHSVGEYVAACIAGVFSLEDGLKLIAARGRLMQALPHDGAMAAIFADQAHVLNCIAPYSQEVSIAAVNGPQNIVISGRDTAIQALMDEFAKEGVKATRLTVSHAFHSPLMEPMLEEFEKIAASVQYSKPKIGVISNVTGELVKDDRLSKATYWRSHIRQAVQFELGMKTLHNQGCKLFLEIGPQPTLIGMGRQCVPDEKQLWLPSLRQRKEDWRQILESLGTMHVNGIEVDWDQFDRGYAHHKIPLPTYPFQRQRYWMNIAKPSNRAAKQSICPLLGRQVRSPSLQATVFETDLSIDSPAYLTDHRIFETAVFPATGYLEMVLAAGHQMFNARLCSLADVSIREAMNLPETGERTVQIILTPAKAENVTFEIYSLNDDSTTWKLHASGSIRLETQTDANPSRANIEQLRESFPKQIKVSDHYNGLAEIGLNYGPAFQGINQIWQGQDEVLGEIILPSSFTDESQNYQIHPALLDACFQLLGAATSSAVSVDASKVYVPVGLRMLKLHQTGHSQLWAHVAFSEPIVNEDGAMKETLNANLRLFDLQGKLVADVSGLQMRQITRAAIRHISNKQLDDWLLELDWQLMERPSESQPLPAKKWLIFIDKDRTGEEIVHQLQIKGGECALVHTGDEYCQIDGNNYRLSPTRPEHFRQLLEDVRASSSQQLGVIHLWSLDNTFDSEGAEANKDGRLLESAQQLMCASILHLVQALEQDSTPHAGLWLITRGVHVLGQERSTPSLAQSCVWGLGRTIALEYPNWKFACVDLDPATSATQSEDLLRFISSSSKENLVALRGIDWYGSRLKHFETHKTALQVPANQSFELVIPTPGVLDHLTLQPVERRAPSRGEVEIRVQASALNFRDVLYALGMYPGPAIALGNECAGVIVTLGEGVTGFKIGDEVVAMMGGAFRSYATISAEHVFAKPKNLNLSQVAALPTAVLTAYYGLHHLAKMKAGDRVLIHAAAGGVGVAAVQLAQQAGAEVFATAGSPEKHAFLRSLGVKHIFSSRTLDFADEIMRITEGKGVHIVLNSLADEFIPRSLSLLADHGYFLEMGKRDDWDQGKVSAINPTISYRRYDLSTELINDPPLIEGMLRHLLHDFETGALQPLPVRTFPIQSVQEAFRYMAQAKHIGKIVIIQEENVPLIRTDSTYLITGGLGGLGLVTARWLSEQGAKHLVLMSRHEPNETTRNELDELRKSRETEIVIAQGNISCKEDIKKVLKQIEHEMPTLRGVFHEAGVLDDGIISQQNWERFEHVMAPKVNGAWHLHTLTQKYALDFFVLFSSAAALLGSPGQSNYTAANAFLDGLASFRRAHGLPAISINWGAWSEVGMAANTSRSTDGARKKQQTKSIDPADGMQILEQLLLRKPIQIGVLPTNWNQLAASGKPIQPLLLNLVKVTAGTTTTEPTRVILEQLKNAPSEKQEALIFHHIKQQVFKIMGFDSSLTIDPERALTDIGMDSLMAVELKNRIDSEFKTSVPLTFFLEEATIAKLSNRIYQQFNIVQPHDEISERHNNKHGDIDAGKAQALLENLDQLSDDQVDSLLDNLLTGKDS
jgi:myxalamid-type polyketide synthase MxaB